MEKLKFLVLDEADQLLSLHSGFEKDVAQIVLHCTKTSCQILLFSATMTLSLQRLNQIANHNDKEEFSPLTKIIVHEHTNNDDDECKIVSKLPAGLVQEYIFMPSHVRDIHLVATIQELLLHGGNTSQYDPNNNHTRRNSNKRQRHKKDIDTLLKQINEDDEEEGKKKARSVILFCSSCERTAHLSTLLTQLHISNLLLHSLLSQSKRFASSHRFKSRQVPILIATDVASRGLDIPTVDLVLNVELPLKPINTLLLLMLLLFISIH